MEEKAIKRLNAVYSSMKGRCYTKTHADFEKYGGRNVTICAEWLDDREAFIKWALANGYEEGLSIDKDQLSYEAGIEPPTYSPETCQWITAAKNLQITAAISNGTEDIDAWIKEGVRSKVFTFSVLEQEDQDLVEKAKNRLKGYQGVTFSGLLLRGLRLLDNNPELSETENEFNTMCYKYNLNKEAILRTFMIAHEVGLKQSQYKEAIEGKDILAIASLEKED